MPSSFFRPGDDCWLVATVHNPDGLLSRAPLFVVLDWAGAIWFAPSWSAWPEEGLDGYWLDPLSPGATEVSVIDPFAWPEGAGSADGLWFHAALTDEAVSMVMGSTDSREFGFGE